MGYQDRDRQSGFQPLPEHKEGWDLFQLNQEIIPGLLSSVTGRAYTYYDEGLTQGKLYYYKLEDIDLGGKKTLHGPVCVDWNGNGVPDDEDPGRLAGGTVTQVLLRDMRAVKTDQGVLIEWSTGFEVNNLGFHVYRQEGNQLSAYP